MNRWLFVCACMLLASTPSLAMDVQGKWGIGASIFKSIDEITILHGHSARTLWAFDASIDQRASRGSRSSLVGDRPGKSDQASLTFGPRLRRFTRATEGLAPYFDVRLDGTYVKNDLSESGLSSSVWSAGLATGLGIGAEYFTPWSFTVALDSDLVSGGFSRMHESTNPGPTFPAVSVWSTHYFTHAGLSPRLVARAYF